MKFCYRIKGKEFFASTILDDFTTSGLFNTYVLTNKLVDGSIRIEIPQKNTRPRKLSHIYMLHNSQFEKIPKYIYYISEKSTLKGGAVLNESSLKDYFHSKKHNIEHFYFYGKSAFTLPTRYVKKKKNPEYKSDLRILIRNILRIRLTPKPSIVFCYPGLLDRPIHLKVTKDDYEVDPS